MSFLFHTYSITGILAGMWPCGIISVMAELYVAESKSQVYGALHDFIQRNRVSLPDLSASLYKITPTSKCGLR